MTSFLERIRRNTSGMTSIEYGLVAALMGTGVLLSMNYIADELTAHVQPKGCTWQHVDPDDEDAAPACIGSPSWSPRIANRPAKARTAAASN